MSPRRESHTSEKTSSSNGSSAATRRDWSHLPASTPGTIRVIHIFAPKVIKTDVANFRALVQKLTGKSKRSGSGSRKRALKTRSLTSISSDGTFSSSTDTNTNQSSAAAETCSESSTRSSNSASHVADSNSDVMAKSALLFSSTGSSTTSANTKVFGLPSYFGSSQTHHQVLPAENSAAFFRSQACTASSGNSRSTNSSSSNHSQSPVMVDPMQSLSGYKDNWSSLQASCFNFSLNAHNQASVQQQPTPIQSQNRQVAYNMSQNTNGFSDMDILTGLVSPGPVPEFSLPPPLINNNNNHNLIINGINNNSVPTSEHFLLSNHPSLCRLSVQPLVSGSVSPFEHF
ncbi:hypothetical protein Mapa_002193 [Marchantia paleacea]|nr:hypothetical protein Mapa_002193 [Marchantia paleacea]